MTPSWLEAHASFIDSSRTATAEQLTFNGGVSRDAALLKVPLIPAGFFKGNTPLTVEITVANDVTIGTMVDSDICLVCQTVPDLSGLILAIRALTLPAIRWKGFLVQLFHPKRLDCTQPNPAKISIPVSFCSLSSWMNAGVRAILHMTEAL